MAYQPKSYRKFVATAATATLVATAVSPAAAAPTSAAAPFTDVSERYKEAVDHVVNEKKYAIGISDTQFGTALNIKRVDAAVMIARALKLEVVDAPDSGFTDVPQRAKSYVDALKAAGVINGKTATSFGAEDPITRGEMALILSRAYDQEGLTGEADHNFTDVSDRYDEAVQALVKHGITDGKTSTQFGTQDPIKRGEFAIFLYRVDKKFPIEPPIKGTIPGVSEVEALNANQIEVTFKEPVDAEQIGFIEEAGNRVVAYSNSETAQTAGLVSTAVNFSDDRKTATVTLADNPSVQGTVTGLAEGVQYTVALVDRYGTDTRLAKEIVKSKPTVLLAGLEAPEVRVAGQDGSQLVFSFDEEMGNAALAARNYTFYDENDQEITQRVVEGNGQFVNRTSNEEVRFDIRPGVLEAGETYRVVINQDVLAKDGSKLADAARNIEFAAPSIAEAKPKASVARVVDDNKITVTFDKELIPFADIDSDTLGLNQFTVSQADGREFDVRRVEVEPGNRNVTLTVAPLEVDGQEVLLRDGREYQVDMPSGFAVNNIYQNAQNDAITDLAVAPATNAEVTSFTAKLERQKDEKDQADLLLTLNQPAEVTGNGTITIENLDEEFTFESPNLEVYEGDPTGKTFILRDVTDAFVPEDGETYRVTIGEGVFRSITTNDREAKRNNKMDAQLQGIDVSAPQVESIKAVSAEEIQVEFDEEVNISGLEETDLRVAGFLQGVTGTVTPAVLTGANLLDVSANGNILTIKPAHDAVKFATGNVTRANDFWVSTNSFLQIQEDSFTDENGIENRRFNSANARHFDPADFKDNAKPVILGTEITDADELRLTYSEAVRFDGQGGNSVRLGEANAQFTVTGALQNGTASEAVRVEDTDDADGLSTNNLVDLTFDQRVFEGAKVYPDAQLSYRANTDSAVEDFRDNKQAAQTIKGLVNTSFERTEDQAIARVQSALERIAAGREDIVDIDGNNVNINAPLAAFQLVDPEPFHQALVDAGVKRVVVGPNTYVLAETDAEDLQAAIINELREDNSASLGIEVPFGEDDTTTVRYNVRLV